MSGVVCSICRKSVAFLIDAICRNCDDALSGSVSSHKQSDGVSPEKVALARRMYVSGELSAWCSARLEAIVRAGPLPIAAVEATLDDMERRRRRYVHILLLQRRS